MRWFLLHPEWVITRKRVGEGAHFPGRCLGVQTWHTNAQIMDITGFYGSDHGSRPWSVLVFSCLMESPAAMLGDLRACLPCPSRWVAPSVSPLQPWSRGWLLLAPPPTLCREVDVGAGSRAPGLAHAHSAAVPSSPHGTSGLFSLLAWVWARSL